MVRQSWVPVWYLLWPGDRAQAGQGVLKTPGEYMGFSLASGVPRNDWRLGENVGRDPTTTSESCSHL